MYCPHQTDNRPLDENEPLMNEDDTIRSTVRTSANMSEILTIVPLQESTPSINLCTNRVYIHCPSTPHDTRDGSASIYLLLSLVSCELVAQYGSRADQCGQCYDLVQHERCVLIYLLQSSTLTRSNTGFFTLILGRIFRIDNFSIAKIGAVVIRCVIHLARETGT